MKLRLFVAAEIDDAMRATARTASQRLSSAGVTGRFEPPEKFHITLAFLGSVPEADLAIVVQALHGASALCHNFELSFERIGAFPDARRPRVLWIGPQHENPMFTACARHVREAYEHLGFTFEHDASAHITICRPAFVPSGALGPLHPSATQTIRGLTLMRSLPAGHTTRYEALERTWFPSGVSP